MLNVGISSVGLVSRNLCTRAKIAPAIAEKTAANVGSFCVKEKNNPTVITINIPKKLVVKIFGSPFIRNPFKITSCISIAIPAHIMKEIYNSYRLGKVYADQAAIMGVSDQSQ